MRGYYYLMASLPTLDCTSNAKAPFTAEQFLENIKLFIPAKDYQTISRLIKGEMVSNPHVQKYDNLKKQVDAQLALSRAKRLGLDISQYKTQGECDSSVVSLVDKVVMCDNPLEAEMMIYSIYWKCLDEIAFLHKFDFVELAVYAVRLRLLIRREQFDRDMGRAEFDRLYTSLHVSLED